MWSAPKEEKNDLNCGTQTIMESYGKAHFTKIEGKKVGRIVDSKKQIEILFYKQEKTLCRSIHHAYSVIGIPDTHIVFASSFLSHFKQKDIRKLTKRNVHYSLDEFRTEIELNKNKRLYNTALAWGHIQLVTEHKYLITTTDIGTNAYLLPEITEFDQKLWKLPPSTHQSFEYLIDNTIRTNNTRLCLTADSTNIITIRNCSTNTSSWVFDHGNHQIIETRLLLCLTAVSTTLLLQPCDISQTTTQKWLIENININPNFREDIPDITLEDLEFAKAESSSEVVAINTDIDKIFNWGRFLIKDKKDTSCVTYDIDTEAINVTTCNREAYHLQKFEYSTDFTIRVLGTDKCLMATEKISKMIPCGRLSQRWARNENTGQYVDSLTGQCLQHTREKIHLGWCNDRARIRRQRWRFEYRSPIVEYPLTTTMLTQTDIIAMQTNQLIDGQSFLPLPGVISRGTDERIMEEIRNITAQLAESNKTNKETKTEAPPTITSTTKATTKPTPTTTATTTTTKIPSTTTTAATTTTTKKPSIITTISTTTTGKSTTTTPSSTTKTRNPTTTTTRIPTTTPTTSTTTRLPTTTSTTTTTQPSSTTTKEITSPTTTTTEQTTPTKYTSEVPITTMTYTREDATIAEYEQDEISIIEPILPTNQPEMLEIASLTMSDSTEKVEIPETTTAQKAITESTSEAERNKKEDKYTIKDLEDEVKRQLEPMHKQYIEGLEIEHENTLATEVRQIYCQLSVIRRNQAITLAQTNGILAATTLKLPQCSRLQGFGQSLLLQECKVRRANITAIETSCGFQPFYAYQNKNYTIGTDGWSLHPYSNCFWQSHLVNFNGKTFSWEHNKTYNEWTEQIPNIHTPNLNLISQFSELPLNDHDFMVKNHPAHEIADLEQLNVLNDLMGRIQDAQSNSLSNIVMSEKQDNNIGTMFSWTRVLKIMTLSVIGFILCVICIRIFIAVNPIPRVVQSIRERQRKLKDKEEAPPETIIPMINPTNPYPQLFNTSAPPMNIISTRETPVVHSHNRCTYIPGRGLVWEDYCPCGPENQ